jgi:acylphosphatase
LLTWQNPIVGRDDMAELASIAAKVHGRVQGVFFRSFVQQQARTLGLTGYARNLPDGGTVEVRAEGSREKLEELANRLRVGPAGAKVDQVEIEWSGYSGGFDGFRIRY